VVSANHVTNAFERREETRMGREWGSLSNLPGILVVEGKTSFLVKNHSPPTFFWSCPQVKRRAPLSKEYKDTVRISN